VRAVPCGCAGSQIPRTKFPLSLLSTFRCSLVSCSSCIFCSRTVDHPEVRRDHRSIKSGNPDPIAFRQGERRSLVGPRPDSGIGRQWCEGQALFKRLPRSHSSSLAAGRRPTRWRLIVAEKLSLTHASGKALSCHQPRIDFANPGVAATVLLITFIAVMAWVWWPEGFLLP
jgi:hypothetical protein